ncbi:MAG TPA: hypothetical protein VFZ09_36255 [Archangium sp.]|uniref:hypothetical protein n=1 Tax=Archangium sp. TaxID=1872627 RepID=UPI002E355DA1|nr:hypothetical protein [Archangium sp.]HEX5751729.1 hypothetical protein [Archangium sp.]
MTKITITIPDHIPHGRKASVLKGIIRKLMPLADVRTPLDYTPEGHELAIQTGEDIAEQIERAIEAHVER